MCARMYRHGYFHKGSGRLVLLSDPLWWLLWTTLTGAICKSSQWITTGTKTDGCWNYFENTLPHCQLTASHTDTHKKIKNKSNKNADTDPDMVTYMFPQTPNPPTHTEFASTSTDRAPKRHTQSGSLFRLLLLSFPLLPVRVHHPWHGKDEEKISGKQTRPTSRLPYTADLWDEFVTAQDVERKICVKASRGKRGLLSDLCAANGEAKVNGEQVASRAENI